jgi:lysyl-tRNA synthetase class 2
MEVELQPFSTEHNWGAQKNRLFLPTSPEIHLKKLLTMGWSEIFEIKKCFRNEELSAHHEPEFWMLEWYRAYSHLEAIVEDVEALILYLSEKGFVVGQPEPLERRSVAELFLQHYNFHLTPKTTYQELRELAYSHSLPVTEEESWDDIFHLLFLLKIEREFGETGPIIVFNYPPSQAALARLTEDGWADRFEVYWRGLELGNAFHELNDPVEQRRRWLKDYQLRQLKGRTQVPIDEEFLQGLEHGMPPSGGIAIGVERLFLACQGLCDLNEVVQFPHNRK